MRLPTRILGVALGLLAASAPAQEADIEHRVKSAFLFNFVKFVTWPNDRFAAADSPVVLCVRPDDAIAPALARTLEGKTLDARPLALRLPAAGADWAGCHLAYLGTNPDAASMPLTDLAAGSVITVHEAPQPRTGGVVRLYVEQRRLRFEVNVVAARDARLQVSSRLLDLATRVER